MSDVGWGSDHLEPPKKRTIPLWVMGCAGGCMFAIGAAAVAVYYGSTRISRWLEIQSDPEVQWPRLAKVLPFEVQPAGFEIAAWPLPIPSIDVWQLDSKAQDLVIYVFAGPGGGDSQAGGEWLSSPKAAPMFAMQEGDFEAAEGTVMLQGRELRCVRFTRSGLESAPSPDDPAEPDASKDDVVPVFSRLHTIRGDGLAIDATAEHSDKRVLIWLVRMSAGTTVSDAEAKAILAPFEIGPVR